MVTTSLIIAAAAIVAVILIVLVVLWIRSRRFRPSADKLSQQRELNQDLEETGFAYEIKGDYFYSLMNCWQREAGYCRLYDEAAPLFNMIMDCEPVTFYYAGKRWLIELWKGQYGITTGGEIGIYNTEREDINTEKFQGTFYENIRNDEMLKMSFVLRRNGKVILQRSAVHWWLTGFKLGQFSRPDSLTMDARITFPDIGMRNAFVESLTEIGYRKKEYSVRRKTVEIHYTKPHTRQMESRNNVSETFVQQTNNNNCKLYEFATAKYSDTLDKLEYAKAMAPEIYTIFIQSLYARGIYEAFDWIKEWLKGRHPDPGPVPPRPPRPPYPPEPPCRPCPPEPPCRPCPPEPPCCPYPPEPPCRPCPPEPPCRPCPPRPQCNLGCHRCQDECRMSQRNQNQEKPCWTEEENQRPYFGYEEQTSVYEIDEIEDTEEFQEEEYSDRPWR